MKKIKISIKEHHYTNTYQPTFRYYDYVREIDFENIDDLDYIYEFVNLYPHSYNVYSNNNRRIKSFEYASAIVLDFDNKEDHNDSNINDFVNSEFANKYNWFLYTSKSHIKGIQDCYHVVLPLYEDITNSDTLHATYTEVFKEIRDSGLRCDYSVRDAGRLIFPSINYSEYNDDYFDNFMFDYHYGGEYYKPVKQEITYSKSYSYNNKSIDDVYTSDNNYTDDDYADNEIFGVFKRMSKESRYKYIKSVVYHINNYNKKHNYKYLTYNKWITIGYSLYTMFGYINGKRLFRILSDGYPGDTIDIIDRQYDYLCGSDISINDSLHTIIKISALIGFNHDMYMKYYFKSKHIFSTSKSYTLYRMMIRKLLISHDIPVEYINNVKIYDYSFKEKTRSFLMEIKDNGEISHITVRLGEMMDIFSEMMNVPRKYITTSITNGIIRRFINKNGVYDITRYIKSKILELISLSDSEYIRVNDINNIMKNIRSYAPSTIQSLLTNKNIELYMFERGIFVDKKKKRFKINGSSIPYMGYKVDKSMITIDDAVSIQKRSYIDFSVVGSGYFNYKYNIMNVRQKNMVMTC